MHHSSGQIIGRLVKCQNANDYLKTEGAKCSFYSQEQDRIYKFVQTDHMTNEKVNE